MAKTVRVTIRRTYNWIDKDPVVDECMALVKKRKLQGNYGRLGLLTGMSPSTFANWDKGGTKRPQHASVRCLVEALGASYEINDSAADMFDLDKETKSAKAWWAKNKPPKKKAKKKSAKKSRSNVTKLAA